MEFDLRAALEAIPDEAKSKEFLTRLDAEGESQDLVGDVTAYLQSRIEASLDEMGAPKIGDDDPALAPARAEAAQATQAAMEKYQSIMNDLEGQLGDLQKKVGADLDDIEAADLKKKISDAS